MAIPIPDIPDDAPFTAEQRQWLRSYLGELVASLAATGGSSRTATVGKPRALFLFGSQSGNAQSLCEGFAEIMNQDGWGAEVVDMEKHATIDLTEEPLVLLITSTWGEGDPPDNAVEFWEKLSAPDFPRLEKTRFSVLALGDTNYADFCEMGKRFDARFEELGAIRLASRTDCDVDYEDPAEEWFRVVTSVLDEIGKDFFTTTVVADPVAQVTVSDADEPYGKKKPFPAVLKLRQKLNKAPSPRDTRHIELVIEGSGLTYEVGDAVSTMPQNDVALVDEILSVLPFNTTVSVTVPDGSKRPLRDALLKEYDVCTISKSLLRKWATFCRHPWLIAAIEDDDELGRIVEGREIIDLIFDFPADFKSGQDFVDLLRRLQPRLYSIASSPKAHPGEVHLTVAKVTYETHGRTRKGVCSTFLCEGLAEDDTVKVHMQPTKHFKLPTDPSRDIIMVGPGTGIAPFRAFLEERQVTAAPGRNWLFFGNAHAATDFFYEDELTAMQEAGFLSRLELAWSRDQAHKIYVQDKIRECAAEVWQWLEGGAHFYVCGDATYMAPDVERALFDLIRRYGGRDDEGAAAYLKTLKDEHRYQRDVY
jgi:sulfite reductase (NADPH) flavoprotein alpha-component